MFFLTTKFVKNRHILANFFYLPKKRPKTNLRLRSILGLLCYLITPIFRYIFVRGLEVTKNVKAIEFEGVWSNL